MLRRSRSGRLWAAATASAVLAGLLGTAPASAATTGNRLTVDQATVEGSATGLGNGYSAGVARTTSMAAEGVASLSVTATANASMAARTTGGVPVTPGASITASAEVRADPAVARPVSALLQVRFWSSTGAQVAVNNGPYTAVSASGWTRISRGATTVPATAATVSVFVVFQTSVAGDRYYVDKWGLWDGSTLPAWSAPTTGPDTTAPSVVGGVVTTPNASAGTIAVSWAPATDNVGVTGYRVYLSASPGSGTAGVPTATVSGTSWTSGQLAPGAYVVQVVALDAAGNASSPSAPLSTTLASPPPPPPTGANLLTANQASLETSTLGFEVGYGGLSIARTTSAAVDGSASLSVTATSPATFAVRTARSWTPVTAGLPYAAAASVRTGPAVVSGHKVLVQLRSYDVNGVQVGVSNGPWTTVGSTGWIRVGAIATMPAGAVRVSMHLVIDTAVVGDTYLADAWGLWQASSLPAWSLPPAVAATSTVFLGDSYSAGTGASKPWARWTTLVSGGRGWLEANFARGGTGYLKTATSSGCGLPYCPTFREMASDAVAAQPDIVVVAGGRNDLGLVGTNPTAVRQAVLDTYAALRTGLPSSTIYAVTPLWDSSTPPAALQTLRQWVIEAASTYNIRLIDNADQWLLGHPEWITTDKVHPNDLGHAQIAAQMLGALG